MTSGKVISRVSCGSTPKSCCAESSRKSAIRTRYFPGGTISKSGVLPTNSPLTQTRAPEGVERKSIFAASLPAFFSRAMRFTTSAAGPVRIVRNVELALPEAAGAGVLALGNRVVADFSALLIEEVLTAEEATALPYSTVSCAHDDTAHVNTTRSRAESCRTQVRLSCPICASILKPLCSQISTNLPQEN